MQIAQIKVSKIMHLSSFSYNMKTITCLKHVKHSENDMNIFADRK